MKPLKDYASASLIYRKDPQTHLPVTHIRAEAKQRPG